VRTSGEKPNSTISFYVDIKLLARILPAASVQGAVLVLVEMRGTGDAKLAGLKVGRCAGEMGFLVCSGGMVPEAFC
jgi:hypothetical protein